VNVRTTEPVIAAGLVVWGIVTRSNLNDAQAKLDESAAAQTTAVAGFKKAYDEITEELGATQESLAEAEQEVKDSSAAADQAQQAADAAQQEAEAVRQQEASAQQAEEKERDQAVKAAESKAEVTKSCAKAYAAALGSLFEGDSVKDQADAVRTQLQSVSADCSAALGGS